mmetsp:Transcript_41655/g.99211  ORF Transcript_41655/g.99211 Transcript_41655/m.99211 type:complete len:307 (+) Transcript_41655:259-1179(+)
MLPAPAVQLVDAVLHLLQHLRVRLRVKGRRGGERHIQQDSCSPAVHRGVVWLPTHHFRRHSVWGPHAGAHPEMRGLRARREAEVAELVGVLLRGDAFLGDQHIFALHIAMHDGLIMQVAQGGQEVHLDPSCHVLCEATFVRVGGDHVEEIAAVAALHHQGHHVRILEDLVESHDVRMREGLVHLDLSLQVPIAKKVAHVARSKASLRDPLCSALLAASGGIALALPALAAPDQAKGALPQRLVAQQLVHRLKGAGVRLLLLLPFGQCYTGLPLQQRLAGVPAQVRGLRTKNGGARLPQQLRVVNGL